ncbi:MAG TPA: phosphoribosylanthranilate isomerase [Candidatus Hydrogenedentes bacterium]|nr:phosphoribosylanthranilate isomerase [Candidatus Hydrogenedentota bacterium]HQL93264.1 phosphoribosylanthranilate isomerase [Candidatus Hydrogenedentota bacterium]
MTIRIKICGITTLDDALAACDAGADAVGFVLAPEARRRNRYVPPETAAEIAAALPPFVTTVAVTVNETAETLAKYLKFAHFVQLHGEEPPELCALFPGRAYKAVRPATPAEMTAALRFPGPALLVDAASAGGRGGTGELGDWSLAARAAGERRIILAGGLAPENVAEAVKQARPWAVDVSSGVESAPGRKDHDKIRQFIRNARGVSLA